MAPSSGAIFLSDQRLHCGLPFRRATESCRADRRRDVRAALKAMIVANEFSGIGSRRIDEGRRGSIGSKVAPTGKSPTQCPAPFAKIFRFTFHPNHLHNPRHPGPHKGAFRDRHERWVRDAMDARSAKDESAHLADGEAVWS
jgi:hypothetical protein